MVHKTLGIVRKKSVSNMDTVVRYSSNVGLADMSHNQGVVTENKLFVEQVTKVLKELIGKLNFDKSNAQLRNCVNVLDLLRRSKAIAFVGPVCSGKTTTLKIVSNALHAAFNVKLRTSVVNTATMTVSDLYGSIDAFTAASKQKNEGDFSKSGIFKIILDVFEREREALGKIPKHEVRPRIMQSIFFDSSSIDQPLTECLLDFIDKTNKREDLRSSGSEFLMHFTL